MTGGRSVPSRTVAGVAAHARRQWTVGGFDRDMERRGVRVRVVDDLAPWRYNKLLNTSATPWAHCLQKTPTSARSWPRCALRTSTYCVTLESNSSRSRYPPHPGRRADATAGPRMEQRSEQLQLAVVIPQHRQRRDRLLQRRDSWIAHRNTIAAPINAALARAARAAPVAVGDEIDFGVAYGAPADTFSWPWTINRGELG
jgi:hypothetical protein